MFLKWWESTWIPASNQVLNRVCSWHGYRLLGSWLFISMLNRPVHIREKVCMFRVISIGEKDTRSHQGKSLYVQSNFHRQKRCKVMSGMDVQTNFSGWRRCKERNEVEWTGTAKMRRAEFMAVHRACKAVYIQSNFHGWRRYEERNEVEWTGTAKLRKAEFMAVHRAYKAMYIQSNFCRWMRYKEKNEVEWTGTAKMRKAEFMAVHRACKAIFWLPPSLNWRKNFWLLWIPNWAGSAVSLNELWSAEMA